jgi:uncharacterized peroxidase-related enzyme
MTIVPLARTTPFPLVDPAVATDPRARQAFDEIQQELGFGMVPNIFRSMGSNPALLLANWQKFKATILQGALPRTVKEMIGVVVSDVHGSEYAKQVHLHSLSVQGVQALWLAQLTDEDLEESVLPETIAAMIAFARKAARDPRAITERDFAALRDSGLSDEEIGEVVATIDLFKSVNAYTDLAAVPIDGI